MTWESTQAEPRVMSRESQLELTQFLKKKSKQPRIDQKNSKKINKFFTHVLFRIDQVICRPEFLIGSDRIKSPFIFS